jgi:gas vesicle protein
MANVNGTDFTLGLVCGAVVGAAVAFLVAPQSGAATRRALARSADGLRLHGADAYDSAVETAAGVSDTVANLADRGTAFIKSATKTATS